MSSNLSTGFQERLAEVEAYLDFLSTMEARAQHGPPRIEGAEHPISTQQQRILYSSVYLQLYNLVEATMSRCVEAIADAAKESGRWKPGDLSDSMRREWVRVTAKTHTNLEPETRLSHALELCNHLLASLPISSFEIDKNSSGNWDDKTIEKFIKNRLGFDFSASDEVRNATKRHIKDELGPLELVKRLRNRLAHGNISFEQCAENVTVSELIVIKDATVNYLKEVVAHFSNYLSSFEYLAPDKRPA